MRINLTQRERDTILAALRYWQADGRNAPGEIQDIADNGIVDNRLRDSEIDTLCVKINV